MISQVTISILLTIIILVQNQDEGFNASGGSSFKVTRRGPELILFRATIVLGILFLLNALMFIIV